MPLRAAHVSVPATSANLGPAFDCAGLALEWRNELRGQPRGDGRVIVEATGEGADSLPTDDRNLAAAATRAGLAALGFEGAGFDLHCSNAIPFGSGLGSSAAAIIGGLGLARAMVPGADFGDDELLRLAGTMEAHPDNIAAALLGSFTIAWVEEQGARAVRLSLHPSVHAVVAVPSGSVPTAKARAALEERVPMGDASFNAGRAALLVHALANPEPDLLLAATADRLHQEARRAVYPESLALVERLRAQGLAAVISGAGPSVLVLQSGADETSAVAQSAGHAWTVRRLDVSVRGVVQLP